MQRSKPEKFTDFLLKVRQMLVSDGMVPVSRCVLLHVLEMHLLRWPSLLPDKTGDWYSGILGPRVLVRRQAHTAGYTRANGNVKTKEVRLHIDHRIEEVTTIKAQCL